MTLSRHSARRFVLVAFAAALLAGGAQSAWAQALHEGAPEAAFGEYSYYDAYPRMDPDNLIDISQWASCWAFTKVEKERLAALAKTAPEPLKEELEIASIHYQVAEIYYNELVRGTAIYNGVSTRETNEQFVFEEQALLGGAQQWLSFNAAECISKMPAHDMPEFAELYPWLADGLGTAYSN